MVRHGAGYYFFRVGQLFPEDVMDRITALLLLLPLMACGVDSTAPSQPFVLSITGPTSQTGDVYQNGSRRCEFTLTATAFGGGEGDYALWLGLEVERFDFTERQWTQAASLDADGMVDFWGSDRVVTGSSVSSISQWDDPDGDSFQLLMTFWFQFYPSMEQGSILHTFDCN